MSTILEVRGLEKRFGAVAALRGVDLELEAGSALAILGPNGAGKSTLLRILAGLAHASAGSVRLAGQSEPRAGVGYLGHATLLYPELSARENLVFAARMARVPEPSARAERLLLEEGLADVAERRTGGFSRGMAQRLSIARARVHDPELMLLDEPYTGLDTRATDRLTRRLCDLRESGRSLVLVSHDIAQAVRLVSEAIILVGGRVAHRARGEELTAERLEAAYSAALDRTA